jgi:hypothetical protein
LTFLVSERVVVSLGEVLHEVADVAIQQSL